MKNQISTLKILQRYPVFQEMHWVAQPRFRISSNWSKILPTAVKKRKWKKVSGNIRTYLWLWWINKVNDNERKMKGKKWNLNEHVYFNVTDNITKWRRIENELIMSMATRSLNI